MLGAMACSFHFLYYQQEVIFDSLFAAITEQSKYLTPSHMLGPSWHNSFGGWSCLLAGRVL